MLQHWVRTLYTCGLPLLFARLVKFGGGGPEKGTLPLSPALHKLLSPNGRLPS